MRPSGRAARLSLRMFVRHLFGVAKLVPGAAGFILQLSGGSFGAAIGFDHRIANKLSEPLFHRSSQLVADTVDTVGVHPDRRSQITLRFCVRLLCVPIGAYQPWIRAHCTPEEAVAMADEARAHFLMPIHHQTFKLSFEPMQEPIQRFLAALQSTPDRVALKDVGETFVLP